MNYLSDLRFSFPSDVAKLNFRKNYPHYETWGNMKKKTITQYFLVILIYST